MPDFQPYPQNLDLIKKVENTAVFLTQTQKVEFSKVQPSLTDTKKNRFTYIKQIDFRKILSSIYRESSGKENKEEPFVDKAKQFLKSCRFQDKGISMHETHHCHF